MRARPARPFTVEFKNKRKSHQPAPMAWDQPEADRPQARRAPHEDPPELNIRDGEPEQQPAREAARIAADALFNKRVDASSPSHALDREEFAPTSEAEVIAGAGRILPDLTWSDPVQVKQQQDAEVRAARRRTLRSKRSGGGKTQALDAGSVSEDYANLCDASNAAEILAARGPVDREAPDPASVQEAPAVGFVAVAGIENEPRGGRDQANRTTFQKTKRQRQPELPLPRGERWKKRLPRVCW
jgi:hypothetical protein